MRCKTIWSVGLVCLASGWGQSFAAEKIDFNRDIRPLLSDRCFQCHGPADKARQANLRFDRRDDKEGPFRIRDGKPAVKSGDLKGSALWYRLTTKDADEAMPPKDSHKKPLTKKEKELFRQWILQGAEFKDFWAFIPAQPKTPRSIKNKSWSSHRIDQFVLARLEREGIRPQPAANKRTIIRRVTFDLTGLPPTRQEIQRFLNDKSSQAYERLVDGLLKRQAYGEHMTKYWLDLVRFADTNGIHHDHSREVTPYRDWVIRAFNNNLPFDKFITYQVAGDLYKKPTLDQQIASGFNRLHLVIDRGTALPAESFHRNVVDRVTAFGTAFIGLTVQCAVCHDHKYDPITQKDFYQLYAFFNNIDSTPETPGRNNHPPFIRVPRPEQRRQLKALNSQLARVDAKMKRLRAAIKKTPKKPTKKSKGKKAKPKKAAKKTFRQRNLAKAQSERKKLTKQLTALRRTIPVTLVMKERKEIRPTFIKIRGEYTKNGAKVNRGTPSFLHPLKKSKPVASRMDLARWLTDKQNPLTARVTVNRIWQQFFGVGLVKTSEDFGAQGQWPSHPDLLDDLTMQFVRTGWNTKKLIKSILLSATYQQSSSAPAVAFKTDPDNRLLARGSRFRLDSEMIRDQILASSGLLVRTMYGRSVKPPQPPNLWKSVSMVSSSTYSFSPDSGAKIRRRSIYSFWKRAMPPPQMTIFDAPTREACIARRERTNTPLQALVLMNEKQYFKAARHFAVRLVDQPKMADTKRLKVAYETVTSHLPDKEELGILVKGLNRVRAAFRQQPTRAKAIAAGLKTTSDRQRIDIAAYTMIINSLFNLDVTKTRQ